MSQFHLVVAALFLTSSLACSSRRLLENESRGASPGASEAEPPVGVLAPDHHSCHEAADPGQESGSPPSSGASTASAGDAALDPSEERVPCAPKPSAEDAAAESTSGGVLAPGTATPSLPLPFDQPPEVPTPGAPSRALVSHVILVSVDGLASRFLQQVIDEGNAPTFRELQSRGAWTHQARTDKTYTITLPNHTSMLTGLPVSPDPGFESFRAHLYTANTDPAPSETLHTLRYPSRTYTPSVFDVVHDNGLSTAMLASKTKFSLFVHTYNEAGRADTIGLDNGRKKIDHVLIHGEPSVLVDDLVSLLTSSPPAFTFVHFNQPDATGHGIGWGSPEYLNAVAQMDNLLGRILAATSSAALSDSTALIVTTDHGGDGTGHFDQNSALNFEIPFYVSCPGVPAGDAYVVFRNRFHPGTENPEYHAARQPLRNGDAGNLALHLLGLPPIPESIIHSAMGLETP